MLNEIYSYKCSDRFEGQKLILELPDTLYTVALFKLLKHFYKVFCKILHFYMIPKILIEYFFIVTMNF